MLTYNAKLYFLGMEFDNFYHLGRHTEIQVSKILQSFGWKTILSPGSRGPADIHAEKGDQKWCIQVKYRSDGIMQLSKTEESRFLEHSLECGCKPILSIVTRYPGGLLLNASNFRDSENPIIVRDKEGNFFGIQMDKFTALFFINLLDCKKIHP